MARSIYIRQTVLALGLVVLFAGGAAQADPDLIRAYVDRSASIPLIKPSWGEFVLHTDSLKSFYSQRGYSAVWVNSAGVPTTLALRLKEKLQRASEQGLSDEDYWDSHVESLYQAALKNSKNWITFELGATEALIRYADHLINGRFDPEQIDSDIKFKKRAFTDYAQLNTIVRNGEVGLMEGLDRLAPGHTRYRELKEALASLRDQRARGGWSTIAAPAAALKLGVTDPVVAKLRERFNLLGYSVSLAGGSLFDAEFDTALRQYQSANGLTVDGIVGTRSEVLRMVNTTVQQRISQVEINMERLRWLPRALESRHVLINLATAEFQAMENGRRTFDFKTVVGQSFRRTPSMRDSITYINLNPYWTIPRSITIKDKLPLLKQDYRYLQKHNMILISEATDKEVNPESIDWDAATPQNFSYYIRQMPGPDNALGVVKFPLQNPWAIYLHDTNEKALFSEGKRHRSSGCIRLEQPLEFAAYLLQDQSGWTLSDLQRFVPMTSDQRPEKIDHSVRLRKAMPVYTIYLTVEKGENGSVRYIEDVYGQDLRVNKAMRNRRVNNEIF